MLVSYSEEQGSKASLTSRIGPTFTMSDFFSQGRNRYNYSLFCSWLFPISIL
jgi:hypothetical protein